MPLVDIHCHILCGIDDGPADITASLEMAAAAVGSGVRTVVATPHVRADFPKVRVDEIADRCVELNAAIKAGGLELEVLSGGEVALSWALEADDGALRLASYAQRGTDLLIETPTVGSVGLPALLSQIHHRGYRVVLAHPERLSDFHERPELLGELVEQGILLQVNAGSLLGSRRRSPAARTAAMICRRGWAGAVASDGHRGWGWRPIGVLEQAQTALTSLLDATSTQILTELAPAAIASGGYLRKVEVPKKRDRLSMLWSH